MNPRTNLSRSRSLPLRGRRPIWAVLAVVVLSLAPAAHAQNCPGGRCSVPMSTTPLAPRYVHPAYYAPAAGPAMASPRVMASPSSPASAAPAPEPGYTPGTPMPASAMPEPTPAVPGSGPGAKCYVWLRAQGLWGYGWKLASGPHAGKWVLDPGSKRKPASGAPASSGAVSSTPPQSAGATQAAPPDHRGRFVRWLCSYRAQHGLGPVGYSEDLEWAALHNCRLQAQAQRSGHYAPNNGWFAVSFWGPTSLDEAIAGWVASPSHNAALLQPSVSTVGLGVEGVSWSANLR